VLPPCCCLVAANKGDGCLFLANQRCGPTLPNRRRAVGLHWRRLPSPWVLAAPHGRGRATSPPRSRTAAAVAGTARRGAARARARSSPRTRDAGPPPGTRRAAGGGSDRAERGDGSGAGRGGGGRAGRDGGGRTERDGGGGGEQIGGATSPSGDRI